MNRSGNKKDRSLDWRFPWLSAARLRERRLARQARAARRFGQSMERYLLQTLVTVDESQRPPMSELSKALSDLDAVKLNLKFFGYEVARRLREASPPRLVAAPPDCALASKASTQADIESDWVAYWAAQLKTGIVYHRKLWELAYVLHAIHHAGHMHAGARGLGFGCGEEPIASYLASLGVSVTITDLAPDDVRAAEWINTAQHASGLEKSFVPDLVDRETFDRMVDFRLVDMTNIPDTLRDYDFCWSICSLEHLGTIANGLDFIENALDTLRPGGLAIHTTEFNCLNDNETIDNWQTVLYERRHFEDIAVRLRTNGHHVAVLDFDTGDRVLDRFIDMPPYPHDMNDAIRKYWGGSDAHLKLTIDGFVTTCFGLIVTKRVMASVV